MLRAARRLGDERPVDGARRRFLGAHALPPEADGDKDGYHRPRSSARCCRRSRRKGWPMRSTRSARASPSRPSRSARVFDAAQALGLPVKLHADQLSNLGGAALAARFGALSADHLEYTDEAGAAAMAAAGTVAVLLPGAFYFLRETQEAAGRPVPPARRADGGGDRLQSRHLAADLAAAGHEHGARRCSA